MSKRADHTIRQDVIADMKKVFERDTVLFSQLHTNRNTWRNIQDRSGVRKTTARSIVRQFFRLVKGIHEHAEAPQGVDGEIASHVFLKYADLLADYEYDQFVEPTSGQ